MRRNLTIAVALFALGPGLAANAAPILPGYWESTDRITAPIQETKTERKCITEAQIESYMTGPVNNHYSCHYNDRHASDGAFSMGGDCVDNNGVPAKVKVDGVYTATSFRMNGHLQIMLGQLALPVTASTDAHRISAECPTQPAEK